MTSPTEGGAEGGAEGGTEGGVEGGAEGWVRLGGDIVYFQNHLHKTRSDRGQVHCYTASWSFKGSLTGPSGYWAYCYPYTYSYLQVGGRREWL